MWIMSKTKTFTGCKQKHPCILPHQCQNNYHTKIPTCMIFSMEEDVMRRVKAFENKKEGITLGVRRI